MSNEKKIEIPAMPEKYRIMLEMLPEEPAGSKEEQAVRWKLRSTILEAYSAELRGEDVGGGVAILALLTGIMTEEAKKQGDEKPKQGTEKTANPTANPAEVNDREGMRKFQAKDAESGKCRRELQDAEGGMDAAGHGRRAHAPHAQPAPAGGQDRDGVHHGVRG